MKNMAINLKTIILGDSGVGKTSIANRFVLDQFNTITHLTIGASYSSKTININNKLYKYYIWDTAGQEKYRSLAPMYYRNAHIAILVYDITNKESFLSIDRWIDELNKFANNNIIIIIIGNKSDLNHKRQISTKKVKNFADEKNIYFIETSAKNNNNIIELFNHISTLISNNNIHELEEIILIDKKNNMNYICC